MSVGNFRLTFWRLSFSFLQYGNIVVPLIIQREFDEITFAVA